MKWLLKFIYLLLSFVFISASYADSQNSQSFNSFVSTLYAKAQEQGFSTDFLNPIFNSIHPILGF